MPVSAPPMSPNLSRAPVMPGVYKYDGMTTLTLMPNIYCLSVRFDEGAKPGMATFRYIFDTGGAIDTRQAWPNAPEQVFGPSATGPYVVKPDDRLCVYVQTATGQPYLIFDGFVRQPSLAISTADKRAGVPFTAQGTPIRCWDTPFMQRLQRSADDYTNATNDHLVDLPLVFNPRGLANCTAVGSNGSTKSQSHPIFLDELYIASYPGNTTVGRLWDIAGIVQYLLAQGNDQAYVHNPSLGSLSALLNSRAPTSGQFFDESISTSYTPSAITMRELDCTSACWPDALEKALNRVGFRFYFDLQQDSNNLPSWTVQFVRVADDNPANFMQVSLQSSGALDPALSNAMEIHVVADPIDTANEYSVEQGLIEVEGCFVFAPLFGILSSDANPTTIKNNFMQDGSGWIGNEDKYRLYGFDECGEGHWDFGTAAFSKVPGDLTPYLGGADADPKQYCKRRRPGTDELLSKDSLGINRRSVLLISMNYKGKAPAVWDGTADWNVCSHTWRLEKTQLAIRITAVSPEAWSISTTHISFGVSAKSSGGVIKGVSAQALSTETHFTLMLCTVIEGDTYIPAVAQKRNACPSKFTTLRVIDARERYRYQVISQNTWYNQTAKPIIARDDSATATADAVARRTAFEMPKVSGPIVIPRFTTVYELGDRITAVNGRNISFQTNSGTGGGEGPTYPRLIGLEWHFDGKQETVIHLEDDRGRRE